MKEWDERHLKWRDESRARIAAGRSDGLDRIFADNDEKHWYDWLHDRYWTVYRFVRDQVVHLYWWGALKNFYLRGLHGWGQQDWWGLDHYLAGWLPDALRHLAEKEHGHPAQILGPDGRAIYSMDYDPETSEETEEGGDGMVAWRDALNRMADGFAAWALLNEYGWHGESEAERELERMHHDGFLLFINNYGSLWD